MASMAIVAGLVFTSIFDFDVQTAGGATVSLAKYSGAPVTLIVNTASKCGFTGQYQGLQELAQAFGEDLQILAFPCHQFAQQEPGSDAEIQAFVKREYGVTFPVLAKVDVNGPTAHPLFAYLKERTSGDAVAPAPWARKGPGEERDVQWNFSKFLAFKGVPVKRFDFSVEPATLAAEIQALIDKHTKGEL